MVVVYNWCCVCFCWIRFVLVGFGCSVGGLVVVISCLVLVCYSEFVT